METKTVKIEFTKTVGAESTYRDIHQSVTGLLDETSWPVHGVSVKHGVSPLDLHEFVIENGLTGREEDKTLTDELDDLVAVAKYDERVEINNAGIHDQLCYLLEVHGAERLRRELVDDGIIPED